MNISQLTVYNQIRPCWQDKFASVVDPWSHVCRVKNLSEKKKKQVRKRREMWTCEHVFWLILFLFQTCTLLDMLFTNLKHSYGIVQFHSHSRSRVYHRCSLFLMKIQEIMDFHLQINNNSFNIHQISHKHYISRN